MKPLSVFKLLFLQIIFLHVGCAGGDSKTGLIGDCFASTRSYLVKMNDQPISIDRSHVIPITRSSSGQTSVTLDFDVNRTPDCFSKYSGILTITVHDPIPGFVFTYSPTVLPPLGSGHQGFRVSMQIPPTQPNGIFDIWLLAPEDPSDYGYCKFNLATN